MKYVCDAFEEMHAYNVNAGFSYPNADHTCLNTCLKYDKIYIWDQFFERWVSLTWW